MEGTASTTTLEDDAQHLAYANVLAARSASPSPSDGWGRPRSVSTISSLESSSGDKPAPCVFREKAHTDCATQHFIIWAATRRNESSRMNEKDRLGCPLLHCTRRFTDHESMLRHLVNCDLLSSCEYWCYDHMRVECFDDNRCQKGFGHSSKRRKMFAVAKKFISSLGHHGTGKATPDSDTLVSPPCASISDQNPDYMSYASASLVSLFSLNGSSSVSWTFRKGNSNSSRRSSQSSSQSSNQSSSQSGGRRSIGHRFSADAKRQSQSTRFPPPTRSNPVVCAELQSTEIVELDSKEISAAPKNALLSPSSPRAYAFSSPADSTGTVSLGPVCNKATLLSPTSPASHCSPVSPLLSADFSMEPSTINPVQLVLSDNDSNTSIVSLSSPASPLPFCPTPPVVTSADFFAKPSTIDPLQLSLSDFDTGNDFQQSLVEWELSNNAAAITPSDIPGSPIASMAPLYIPAGVDLPSPSSRPQRPASTTSSRSKNLSPSSSVRSTTSTWSSLTTTSTMTAATTISNVSDVSDVSTLSEAACTSAAASDFPLPSEGEQAYHSWLPIDRPNATTTVDVMGDVGYSDFFNDLYSENYRSVPEEACYPNQSSDYYVPPSGSMAMNGMFTSTDLFAQDHSAFVETALQQEPHSERLQDNGKNDSTSSASKDTAHLIPDVNSLAVRTWDVLSSRIVDSLSKLRNFNSADNALAVQLRGATPKQIVDAGLSTLQRVLLSGSSVDSPFGMLCLLHVVHAFSSANHETDAVQSEKLFSQALTYSAHYASPDRENYIEVASLLWQPGELTTVPATGGTITGVHDAVVSNAKAFLDDLEIAAILGNTPPQAVTMLNSSDLILRHSFQQDDCQTEAFLSTVDTILQALSQGYSRENSLGSVFRAIGQRAACGALSSVRRLEIELIQAGKDHLDSSAKLNEYVHQTRVLCDVAYAKQAYPTTQRSVFHQEGISLLRLLFAATEGCPVSPAAVSPKDTRMDAVFTDLGFGQGPPVCKADATAAVLTSVDIQGRSLVPAAEEGKVPPSHPFTSKEASATKKKASISVGEKCTRCNYRPKGDPEWFQGSMAKHMMTKHSEAEVYYECSFPGCKSRYRNREDNLRQHEKKIHGIGDGKKRSVQDLVGEAANGGAAKRRKIGQ